MAASGGLLLIFYKCAALHILLTVINTSNVNVFGDSVHIYKKKILNLNVFKYLPYDKPQLDFSKTRNSRHRGRVGSSPAL